MPSKKNDALPGDRLLALYQRLTLNGRRHFLGDLCRDLGRSPQAINRMVAVIEGHLGKDAHIEKGVEGRRRYFQLRSKAEERALGFSFDELRFLANCRDLAAPHLPEDVVGRIDRTLTAMAVQLGEADQLRFGSPVGFRSKGYIDYGPHLQTVSTLRHAIERRQICAVLYKPGGGREPKTYRYAPGQILATSGSLYVQGFQLEENSLMRGRPTTFSLHRIIRADLTDEWFGFNAADEDIRHFGLGWHAPKRVSVQVDAVAADYVRDRIWSADQSIVDLADGGVEITMTTTSEKELTAWVLSFAGRARIVRGDAADSVSCAGAQTGERDDK